MSKGGNRKILNNMFDNVCTKFTVREKVMQTLKTANRANKPNARSAMHTTNLKMFMLPRYFVDKV
jgi:hypothetical protein